MTTSSNSPETPEAPLQEKQARDDSPETIEPLPHENQEHDDSPETIEPLSQVKQGHDVSHSIDLLGWMIDVILADGKIEDHEQNLLYEFCQRCGVSHQQVDEMIARTQKWGNVVDLRPQSKEEALAWLKSMVIAGLADGSVSQDELLIIRVAGHKLGFSDFEINRMIFTVRKDLAKADQEEKLSFFG